VTASIRVYLVASRAAAPGGCALSGAVHGVRVDATGGAIGCRFSTASAAGAMSANRQTFGYDYADQQKVEFVKFCVYGFGLIDAFAVPRF